MAAVIPKPFARGKPFYFPEALLLRPHGLVSSTSLLFSLRSTIGFISFSSIPLLSFRIYPTKKKATYEDTGVDGEVSGDE